MTSTGVLFAGTGEANPGGGSITYGGSGIYRSIDGGATWQVVGLTELWRYRPAGSGSTRPIRSTFSPPWPATCTTTAGSAASTSRPMEDRPGRRRWPATTIQLGLSTWPSIRPTQTVSSQPCGTIFREPDLRTYGGVGSGVYRSIDGGTTWQRLAGGLPASSPTIGRIGVALAPSNPQRLYAIIIQTGGLFQGFYRSENGGDTWTKLPTDSALSSAQSSYGWWFGRLWVDPRSTTRMCSGPEFICVSRKTAGPHFRKRLARIPIITP